MSQRDRRVVQRTDDEEPDMSVYPNPGLEAELAYRREQLMALGRGTRTRRRPGLPFPRRPHRPAE